jgi:hypothetical protein
MGLAHITTSSHAFPFSRSLRVVEAKRIELLHFCPLQAKPLYQLSYTPFELHLSLAGADCGRQCKNHRQKRNFPLRRERFGPAWSKI